ncbi:YcgN family cysteine cluster protein [Oricola sp.]|uniref:YcgN family cysteine cluster protein n=1 Tax=Oricola sp. TaxID=1979950 RepID=UPI0025EA3807|nr:YcgN family cysteine cluster protein [Oricola sp.]MCI5076799.1 YcgN family cysteine cluster protein [Oricola sp.]
MTVSAPPSDIRHRFWETVPLEEMTSSEWEALCDGCGKCCMSKLIDDDTDEIYYTTVACRLFDAGFCGCTDYENRQKLVPDCVRLTPENVRTIPWLPRTCAYRLIAEGGTLFDWHPLITGNPESVHDASMSMRDRVTAFEQDMEHDGEYLDHLVEEGM